MLTLHDLFIEQQHVRMLLILHLKMEKIPLNIEQLDLIYDSEFVGGHNVHCVIFIFHTRL